MNQLQGSRLSVNLIELKLCISWILRADLENETIAESLRSGKVEIPKPLEVIQSGSITSLGISYDEVWCMLPAQQQKTFLDKLKKSLGGVHHALIENTDAYCQYALQGEDAATLLQHLIAYDWSALEGAKVIATMMQSVPITVYRKPSDETYYLLIRRSFAEHAVHLIQHTAQII